MSSPGGNESGSAPATKLPNLPKGSRLLGLFALGGVSGGRKAARLDDLAALRLERQTLLRPGHEAAFDAVGVEAGGAQRLRRGGGAMAAAAVDDELLGLVEIAGAVLQLVERDQLVARDVAGVVLLGVAHVYHPGAAIPGQLGGALGRQLGRCVGVRHSREPSEPQRPQGSLSPHGLAPSHRPAFSSSASRCQGLMLGPVPAGAGAVSRRNCSIAAAMAAASSGEAAAWRISMRGRGGACLPFLDTAGSLPAPISSRRCPTSPYSATTPCSPRSARSRRSSASATASCATPRASGGCRRRSTSTHRRTATSAPCRRGGPASRW